MNPDELRNAAAVMLAAAEGRAIQWKSKLDVDLWYDMHGFCFDWRNFEYRIKPEPRKVKVRLCRNSEGTIEPWFVNEPSRDWQPCSDIVEIEVKE